MGVAVPTNAAQAGEVATNTSWASGWANVPAATGASLASGVLNSYGAPSSGATVILFVLPVHVPAGTSTLTPISRATTSANGEWAVAVPARTDLTAYADARSKMVNFEIKTFDGTGSTSYFLSARLTPSLAAVHDIEPSALDAGHALLQGQLMSLATDPVAASGIKLDSRQEKMRTDAQSAAPSVVNGDPPPRPVCTTKTIGDYQERTSLIGATFDDSADATAEDFVHSVGSSSSLGVGVADGDTPFSESGTLSASSSVEIKFAATHNVAHQNYYATVDYKMVDEKCVRCGHHTESKTMEEDGFDGGYKVSIAAAKSMGYCVPEPHGALVKVDTTAAYTVGAGVDVASIIGIDLTAETGYPTDTQIQFNIGTHGHPWCGLSAVPSGKFGAPKLLDVHPNIIP